MYIAALACAWVVDPANCSPFGRMQGISFVGGEIVCLSAATKIRDMPGSTVPVPGNVSAFFWLWQSGRLRLPFCDLLEPAIALAQQGFKLNPAVATAVRTLAPEMNEDLRKIYLVESGAVSTSIRNPALAELLQILAESANEHDFWRTLRTRDPGPWQPEESLDNPVRQYTPRALNLSDGKGHVHRLLTTGALESWGTWILLSVAIAVELRECRVLGDFSRAVEAYVLSTILLLDRIPFAVGSLRPKVVRPSVELDLESEAAAIAERVVRLLDLPPKLLWEELATTYFVGAGSYTDDSNTNAFAIASGDDYLSFTTSIGPWFGSMRTWWGAALCYSYAMKSGELFEGQTHDVTEMSPLILESAGGARLAIGAAGSERILGVLTYLLFFKYGLGECDRMANLMLRPRLFPKDGAIRVHKDFCSTARAHLENRGFALAPTEYDLERHLGIVNLVERIDSRRYKSGADPSGSGGAL
ncbi:gamma-glutamyltranspeptidase / glutathione hydrolase [Rhizobium tibeticum]|uniref:Gamma-glutamyltransferase n=1 Tax=Rhizobium tibeticum TaxID=501024 RepID=A0A1H8WW55_9HYPH|nr:gamma-glutamyltransferase [Rhizobium tibeticum]SEI21868.1 gamma-glutamyltransferase [Rhizobium tibeticum]SEP31940.1 gamma-glutamyltranspeptidase / glutathione hydrolase [Rhizobium tibeticum]